MEIVVKCGVSVYQYFSALTMPLWRTAIIHRIFEPIVVSLPGILIFHLRRVALTYNLTPRTPIPILYCIQDR